MNNHINYVELAAKDLVATQAFFEQVFDWQFESYGPDYIAFANSALMAAFSEPMCLLNKRKVERS